MKSFHTAILCLILGYLCQGALAAEMSAKCDLEADSPQPIIGTVMLSQSDDDAEVKMVLDISGFSTTDQYTKHGFHVHETGDISGGCGSTGGHYNPDKVDHGAPSDSVRHVGDLGNIVEDNDGNIKITLTDPVISLYGDRTIIARAIVIHEKEDDLGKGDDEGSRSTGNAGSRLACCVITEPEYSGASIGVISPVLLLITLLIALTQMQ